MQPSPRSIVVGTSLGYWISGGEIRAWALDSTPASTIVTNQPSAYALAVDLFAVYWTTESGTVMSAPLDPKLGAPTTLASGLNHPLAIAASDSEIYFTTVGTGAGMIAKVSKSGGPVTVIASKRKRPVALAVDERYVYWTDAEQGTVERAPR